MKIITNSKRYKKIILASLSLALITGTAAFAMTQIYSNTGVKKVKIVWTGQNVLNCRASGGYGTVWTGPLALNGELTIPDNSIPVPGIYDFYITCDDDDSAATFTAGPAQVEVLASKVQLSASNSPVPTNPFLKLDFTARYTFLTYNYNNLLSWNFSDSQGTCTASGDWSGAKSPIGSFSYKNTNASEDPIQKNYTLTCRSASGEIKTATIPVTDGAYVCKPTKYNNCID